MFLRYCNKGAYYAGIHVLHLEKQMHSCLWKIVLGEVHNTRHTNANFWKSFIPSQKNYTALSKCITMIILTLKFNIYLNYNSKDKKTIVVMSMNAIKVFIVSGKQIRPSLFNYPNIYTDTWPWVALGEYIQNNIKNFSNYSK